MGGGEVGEALLRNSPLIRNYTSPGRSDTESFPCPEVMYLFRFRYKERHIVLVFWFHPPFALGIAEQSSARHVGTLVDDNCGQKGATGGKLLIGDLLKHDIERIDASGVGHTQLNCSRKVGVTDESLFLSGIGEPGINNFVNHHTISTGGFSTFSCPKNPIRWVVPSGWGNRSQHKRGDRVQVLGLAVSAPPHVVIPDMGIETTDAWASTNVAGPRNFTFLPKERHYKRANSTNSQNNP